MTDFINTIDVLGDDAVIDSLLTRTITEFRDNRVMKVRNYAFQYCSKLAIVDLPNVSSIGACAFADCTSMQTLIIRGNRVCTLSGSEGQTAVLANTPIASGTGYIYVPAALVDSYKAATNWSNYASQFRALEDYTVDGTVTGELDESKI